MGSSGEGSPAASFDITDEGAQNSSDRQPRKTKFRLEDLRIMAKKVELPTFNGDDPYGWIARAEFYFSVQGVPPELQLQQAQLCMEGMPWHWFKLLKEEDPNLD